MNEIKTDFVVRDIDKHNVLFFLIVLICLICKSIKINENDKFINMIHYVQKSKKTTDYFDCIFKRIWFW